MTGIGVGVYGILLLAIGALALLICLFQGRRRRRGGFASACLILLIALGGFALLLPLRLRSQASAAHTQAVAMKEQARLDAKMRRAQLNRDSLENPEPDADEDPSDESGMDNTETIVEETQEKADGIAEELDSKIESTIDAAVGAHSVHVQTSRAPKSPRPPKVHTIGIRSGLSDRSTRAQILTGTLLAGVILAGYFFLNANTRGHYTWRLRIGSTLVFIASLVVILLVTNCI